MSKYAIGIDYGTLSVRALLVNTRLFGRITCYSKRCCFKK